MKTYFRYERVDPFLGVIGSCKSNILYREKIRIPSISSDYINCVICGALENVALWNMKNSQEILTLSGDKSNVTQIAYHKSNIIAAGYCDGDIRVWNINEKESPILFKGHVSQITTLEFDAACSFLVSGSMDTFLIIWDIVNECGLYKLKGHSGPITACYFMTTAKVLISSSKDTYIKLWDLQTQHCFVTLLGHDSEVWDFKLFDNETSLISATSSEQLRLWKLDHQHEQQFGKRSQDMKTIDVPIKCHQAGSIIKKYPGRCKMLKINQSGSCLIAVSKRNQIEVFKISEETFNKDSQPFSLPARFTPLTSLIIKDLFTLDVHFDIHMEYINIATLLKDNYIEIYKTFNDTSTKKLNTLSYKGHRSPPTCVTLNSNATYFCTASLNEIKLWNIDNKHCIRTISTDLSTSLLYLPGDKFLVSGSKSGQIRCYNISNGETIEVIDAHSNTIWDIKLHPTENYFASASSDKTIKFWRYNIESNSISMMHQRTLEMDEDALSLVYSWDGKYIAVALIDCNVKIFYHDSLKYYLTLYGHKLPINSIDISSDNQLVITGSGDKNIKIWGLDFGDIRRSLFAHDSSINCVKFVPQTHYFFSCSNDGSIKYWDADSFILIQQMDGHREKVTKFAMGYDGDILVSVSEDFSIRIWHRTEELLVPKLDNEDEDIEADVKNKVLVKEVEEEAMVPLKPTVMSLKAIENLIEAIDLMENEEKKSVNEDPHPILNTMKMSAKQYVCHVLVTIPSANIDVTLTTLPYKYVIKLLHLCCVWLKNGCHVELCIKCYMFLVKLHFYQLINTQGIDKLIEELSLHSKQQLHDIQERVGVNMAWMNHVKRSIESQQNTNIFSNFKPRHKR